MATTVVEDRPVAVTGDWDGRVQVWDVDTRTEVARRGRPTPHTGPVWALAAAVVDGRPLVVTGGDDRAVRVWDLGSHRPVGWECSAPRPPGHGPAAAPPGPLGAAGAPRGPDEAGVTVVWR
ncbi:hypothetical protein OG881_19010 [Streptomyces virginiae]|nr:hypothetical protein [Streptomyces virginiae]